MKSGEGENPTSNTNSVKPLSKKSRVLLLTAIIGILGNIAIAAIGAYGNIRVAAAGKKAVGDEANQAVERLAHITVATGSILPFGGEIDDALLEKEGWLFCNGKSVSTNTYPKLFARIHYSWGRGETSDSFRLPDLRGVFIRGVTGESPIPYSDPESTGRTNKYQGGAIGNHVGSFQMDVFKRHTHASVNAFPNNDPKNGGAWGETDDQGHNNAGKATSHVLTEGADNNGVAQWVRHAGESPETRPKNAYVYFIIKY